jgi:hypothetical protein
MEDGKRLSYEKTLEPHVGEEVIARFMEQKPDNSAGFREIKGQLSKGPIYYSVHGKEGTVILMPGWSGEIVIEGKKYNLPDLI